MYKKVEFRNNLKLLVIPMQNTASITLMVFVKAGGRYEAIEKSGLSHYVEHTIFKGTKKRPNPKDISEAVESVGGIQNAATGHEFTYYFVKVPAEKIEVAFDVLSDILFNSQFEKKAVEREKQVILEEINVYNDSPIDKISDYFISLLWPNHPLGTELTGTKEQFSGLKREDILKYVADYYVPNNMLVTIAGDVKESLAQRLTEKYFLGKSSKKISPFEKAVDKQDAPRQILHFKKTDQTHFYLGFRSLPLNHKDRYVLEVLTAVLGKGMSSRLFESLREKNGLCYYIGAGSLPFSDTGVWFVRAGVDNSRFLKAVDLTMRELKKIKNARVPKKELNRAKEYLKGKLNLSMEASDSQASFYGMQELLLNETLTPQEVCNEIDKVKNDDVLRLANELFVGKNLNLAAITPFKDEEKLKSLLDI